MLNPMDALVKELRKMNEGLADRLDKIIKLLDTLIEVGRDDRYGDGR